MVSFSETGVMTMLPSSDMVMSKLDFLEIPIFLQISIGITTRPKLSILRI